MGCILKANLLKGGDYRAMNSTERFARFFHGEEDVDRLPVIEWATWWEQTIANWQQQGLSRDLEYLSGIQAYFGQDYLKQF